MRLELPTQSETERIESAAHWIGRRHGYMAAAVIRLGRVYFSEAVLTAGIRCDDSTVRLFFNRPFFAALSEAELAGVLVHEAFHFLFRHQARAEMIKQPWDRQLFDFACEAVINDIIAAYFPDFKLPGIPVRGLSLVGQDVSTLSAEQVLASLKAQREEDPLGQKLVGRMPSDDHAVWDSPDLVEDAEQADEDAALGPEENGRLTGEPRGWSNETDARVQRIVGAHGPIDVAYGSTPLGMLRFVPPRRVRKDLRRYLLDATRPSARYRTEWNRVPRNSLAVYPEVVLPHYEPEKRFRTVLIAVDASGSMPDAFFADAVQVARQTRGAGNTWLITFDTEPYELDPDSPSARGGGGTRAQAVEEYACLKCDRYPDIVVLITDGFTPAPVPLHPERWTWILPAWGSTDAIPARSRVEYFDAEEGRASTA